MRLATDHGLMVGQEDILISSILDMMLEQARSFEISPSSGRKGPVLESTSIHLERVEKSRQEVQEKGKRNMKSSPSAQLDQRHTLVAISFVIHALLSLLSHCKLLVVSRCCIAKRPMQGTGN